MKKKPAKTAILLLALISFTAKAFTQTVVVTDDNTYVTGQASSVLDVKSTSKGFLAPRMTLAQRVAIAGPAEGLLVYQTDFAKGFYYFTSTVWVNLAAGSGTQWTTTGSNIYYNTGNVGIGTTTPATALHIVGTNPLTLTGVQDGSITDSLLTITSGTIRKLPYPTLVSASSWSLTGNAGINPGTNFLGTTDNKSLRFRSNAVQRMIVDSLGNIGIGTSPAFTNGTFREKFLVDAGTTSSYNAVVAKGTINNYLQLNIQNLSNGVSASSDVVATADNGNESVNYVDMGINSSNNSQNIMGGANDAYLYTTGNNLLVGTGTAAKSMVFMTGGTTQSTNERMRIDGSGNVGIGITNPANPLVVKDTMEIRRTGTLSELLFSNTAGTGDFRIAGDGGDIFWQGGGSRNLQMGAYWGIQLSGDRQTGVLPSFSAGVANTGVLVQAQRDLSVPLAIQANSATQSANLTEWRSSTTTMDVVDEFGKVGIGTTAPATALHVVGTNPLTLTGVQTGAVSDSILTIASGTVRKLPYSTVASGSSWSLTGNASTNSGVNFLGTTDLKSLRFRTNNTQGMILDSLGNVGIGTSPAFTAGTNQEQLLVDAGATGSFNAIVGRGSINNYLQLNIQNLSSGTSASSDVVATSNNGNESINYVDLGINSSTNTQNIMGGANDAYLYTTGNNFLIGTGTAAKALVFMTGGTTQSTNERMRIDGNGKVGIGTTTPATALQVVGTNPLTLNGVQTGATSDSILTITSGTVRKLPFSTLTSGASWSLTGNTGTNYATNFLGTADNTSLRFRTNNTQGMILDSLGNVGIGASPAFTAGANQEQLLVDAGTTSSFNAIVAKGTINSYLQLNIQNLSNGTSASSDVVATSNNGNESINYVDLGINSSTNTQNIMGAANDAYLYTTGNNFLIGTGTAAKALVFMTGGTTQSTNERMRIDGSGNVGVATTTPTAKMDVAGTYKLGTAGTVLTNMIKTSVAVSDATTFSYTATEAVTVTVTGATVNATVIVNPRSALPAGIGIGWSRVISTNNVTIGFTNTDTTPRAVGTITFDVTIIQ